MTIKNVRHLPPLRIELSRTERKHLILTGRNGSGKTSVLETLKQILVDQPISGQVVLGLGQDSYIDFNLPRKELDTKLENLTVQVFFPAKRGAEFQEPSGVQTAPYSGTFFLQHLVNLKANRSFARDEGDELGAEKIDRWFAQFEDSLRDLMDEPGLKLEFDRKNFTFRIVQPGRKPYSLNQLSDGYSAVLSIVTELMMRMAQPAPEVYDAQGIVLIDEIETHLHIALQKKILPFLTRFFPHIQFIVSTHSPFVLTSLPNAVVYDLEQQVQVEDLSRYSSEAVVEGYFNMDKYSDSLKEEVAAYERLSQLPARSPEEQARYEALRASFRELLNFDELIVKIQQIELSSIRP
ncbi:MAG: AAA family ATPase [Bacteroidia bacterium]|nr:AAA family ATPase [Bacteroidia bacterium]